MRTLVWVDWLLVVLALMLVASVILVAVGMAKDRRQRHEDEELGRSLRHIDECVEAAGQQLADEADLWLAGELDLEDDE